MTLLSKRKDTKAMKRVGEIYKKTMNQLFNNEESKEIEKELSFDEALKIINKGIPKEEKKETPILEEYEYLNQFVLWLEF